MKTGPLGRVFFCYPALLFESPCPLPSPSFTATTFARTSSSSLLPLPLLPLLRPLFVPPFRGNQESVLTRNPLYDPPSASSLLSTLTRIFLPSPVSSARFRLAGCAPLDRLPDQAERCAQFPYAVAGCVLRCEHRLAQTCFAAFARSPALHRLARLPHPRPQDHGSALGVRGRARTPLPRAVRGESLHVWHRQPMCAQHARKLKRTCTHCILHRALLCSDAGRRGKRTPSRTSARTLGSTT